MVCFSNNDYSEDPSFSGIILYVPVVLISWQSKAQRSVMLSSSEAEWVALSESVFMIKLCGSMKISVKLPVMVKVNNLGTTFLASYITTTLNTKHIDIKYKCVNEYVKDKVVKITLLHLLKMTLTFSPNT